MFQIVVRAKSVGLWAFMVASVALAVATGPVRAASVGGARCHCPCTLTCGGGITCDCTAHAESCSKCSCTSVQIERKDFFLLAESESAHMVLRGAYADWFRFEPDREIGAALEGTASLTGEKLSFPVRFVLESKDAMLYVPDKTFDADAFRAWARRVEPDRPVHLYAAAKSDPATYVITDGDRKHLNESMNKVYSVDLGNGSWLPIYTSDSTLAWEMTTYLRSAVGELQKEAFLGDAHEVQGHLYDMIETADLLIKASDFDGAAGVLDDLLSRSETGWLNTKSSGASSTLCAFRKLRKLLGPEKSLGAE